MAYFVANIEMSTHECGTCGVVYALTKQFERERLKDHGTFYCPNGHTWHYPQESEEERLKRMLGQKRKCCIAAREKANALERSCSAYKGHVTRLKKSKKN